MVQRILFNLVVLIFCSSVETDAQNTGAFPKSVTRCYSNGYLPSPFIYRLPYQVGWRPANKMVKRNLVQDGFRHFVNKEIELTQVGRPILPKILQPADLGFERDFVVRNYSFFCRQEYRLQKVTGLPLRFRLGSLEYVEQLEGKTRK